MIRIGRTLEVLQVAVNARRIRIRQVVIVVHVAVRAGHGGVRPSQRESGGRVIEARTIPRSCVVTLLAGLRKARRYVIRVRRSLEILQVAADASRNRDVVVVVDVALGALQCRVRTGQRESRVVVIERGLRPCSRVVALLAGLREA